MCGLDEPPEFSLQLWTSLGGKRQNERLEKKIIPEGNLGAKSN